MALSDAEIKVLYADETGFILDESPAALLDFARAIEAEVRKQDTELIQQLVEALDATHGWWGDGEWYGPKTPHWHELTSVARSSARAWLESKP